MMACGGSERLRRLAQAVEVLLVGGADVMLEANQRKSVGRTLPVHEAAKNGSSEVMIRLLSAGKKVEVGVKDMLGRQNAEGETATPTSQPRASPSFPLLSCPILCSHILTARSFVTLDQNLRLFLYPEPVRVCHGPDGKRCVVPHHQPPEDN